ncbi:hypothetical protein EPN95_01900 [Patescibacteria group bacterium]|nr:MAG: hypothetical protein EPN95_01900 [Patescibacteria group bacterium]
MITSAREPIGVSGLLPENETKPTEGHIRVHHTSPGDSDFTYWLDQRHKYMQKMGWNLESEYDHYDDDPATKSILISDDKDKLIVGMRLTPINGYQSSLSWDMLKTAPHMQQEVVDSGSLDTESPVWDLTKLIQGDTRFSPELSQEAIGRLFGEGLQDSRVAGLDEPTWVFAITKPLFRLLSANGMHLRALSEGRISPDDRTESVFGYVRTIEDLRKSARSSIARTTIGVLSDV